MLMGILNVTPDSFSDGGRFATPAAAVDAAFEMADDGADIVDVGGESTHPDGQPIDAFTEWERVRPVIEGLAEQNFSRPVSIDTYHAETARSALAGGAHIVNDVWGLQHDPAMAHVVAEAGAPLIAMHNRSVVDPKLDIVSDVLRYLERSLLLADRAGVSRSRIVLDPGFGFGKTFRQSMELLTSLEKIAALGFPLLIGLSRKGFIGHFSGGLKPADRLAGTLAANLLAAHSGFANILRVHDVTPHRQALGVLKGLRGVQ